MPSRANSLKTYRAKRDFTKSPEPAGVIKKTRTKTEAKKSAAPVLFFCVQKHLASHLHYDFRLEHRGVLLSWAVPKGPSLNPKDKRLAMRVEDHPFDYGEFEGVIPSGYGAGLVLLWDRGTWKPESPDLDAALEAGQLKFSLDGVKLKGSWALVRLPNNSKSWLLIKHKDAWAGELDIESFAPLSVKSNADYAQILGANKGNLADMESLSAGRNGEAAQMLAAVVAQVKAGKVKKVGGAKAKAAVWRSK